MFHTICYHDLCKHLLFTYLLLSKVISALSKYGPKAVNWAKNHKGQIANWLLHGLSIPDIVQNVKNAVGIK